MKLRVVGWTYYDNHLFKEGYVNWAARNALVDEIRKNGYLFSGYDHQECYNCAPVFNDGKIRRFSQRGFADVMAEANGDNYYMAYSLYMFGLDRSMCKYPEKEIYTDDVEAEKNLEETFVVEVDEQTFANTQTVKRLETGSYVSIKKKIKLLDSPKLRYIDEGDTLVLTCNGKHSAFRILDVERDRGLSSEELHKYQDKMNPYDNPKGYEKVRKEFMALPVYVNLEVKKRRKYQFDNQGE